MSSTFPASDGDVASTLSSSAYTLASRFRPETDEDEIDSLPSGAASDSSLEADISPYDSDSESDAEEEWRESMQQLELLLTMVLIPFVGKFLGRKCAYWGMPTRHQTPKYVIFFWLPSLTVDALPGWGKFMEWKYPAEVTIGGDWYSRRPAAQKAFATL